MRETAGRWAVAVIACAVLGAAQAKLPSQPATDEQKAKAEEAKAKADAAAKLEAGQLGKAQDRAAGNYRKQKGKSAAAEKK